MRVEHIPSKEKPVNPKELAKEKLKTATTQAQKIDIILEHLGLKEG
jgi:hypothetical protein